MGLLTATTYPRTLPPPQAAERRTTMTPDASSWRSAAAYRYVETLSASDLAWEWLRRNDGYDQDFEALTQNASDPQPQMARIRERWGLRFPGRSAQRAAQCAGVLVVRGRRQHHPARSGPGPSYRGWRNPEPDSCFRRGCGLRCLRSRRRTAPPARTRRR
ncbi:transcriptional regulator domain-containing protein [Bosea vestrisii]|uniref:Transcriptional regulator domain-containing protein n=1 Tax=Bosea vestrisii TaxID=151416 RepID=A0ABW0HBQ2_9HYPH